MRNGGEDGDAGSDQSADEDDEADQWEDIDEEVKEWHTYWHLAHIERVSFFTQSFN